MTKSRDSINPVPGSVSQQDSLGATTLTWWLCRVLGEGLLVSQNCRERMPRTLRARVCKPRPRVDGLILGDFYRFPGTTSPTPLHPCQSLLFSAFHFTGFKGLSRPVCSPKNYVQTSIRLEIFALCSVAWKNNAWSLLFHWLLRFRY